VAAPRLSAADAQPRLVPGCVRQQIACVPSGNERVSVASEASVAALRRCKRRVACGRCAACDRWPRPTTYTRGFAYAGIRLAELILAELVR
jgi:hypothetical protein